MTQQSQGSFFRDLSINYKLALGFGIVIVLTLVLGVFTLYTTNLEGQALERIRRNEEALLLAGEMEIEFLRARLLEETFFSRWQQEGIDVAYENYIVPNQAAIEIVRENNDALIALFQESESLTSNIEVAETLLGQADNYEAILDNLISDVQQIGFVDTGLEGQIREAIQALESSPHIAFNPNLNVTLLQIRRHEKDFILRRDLEDANIAVGFVDNLKFQIEDLGLSDVESAPLLAHADNYRESFNEMVDRFQSVSANNIQLSALVTDALPLIEELVTVTQADRIAAQENFDQLERTLLILDPIIIVLSIGLGIAAAFLIARSIGVPVITLTNTARDIADGDFSQRVTVQSNDELGQLGTTFNRMVERIVTRNRDVQAIVDVSEQITTILDEDRLLQDVVDLVKERFSLYHAHIYRLNETGDTLVLTAGAGYVGRRMVAENRIIAMENRESIVAGTARSRGNTVVNNVRASENFLPHPLLPDTNSELAVALVSRGQLLGVLDVQSDKVDFFDKDVLAVMQTLAAQISNALSNARLYQNSQRTARHSEAMSQIQDSMQSAVDMDDMIERTTRELAKALRVPYAAIEFALDAPNGNLSADDNYNEGEK